MVLANGKQYGLVVSPKYEAAYLAMPPPIILGVDF